MIFSPEKFKYCSPHLNLPENSEPSQIENNFTNILYLCERKTKSVRKY